MTSVEVASVAKSYGSLQILSDVSSQFAEGSFTSLLGPSGSGKTTLLRIIAGFVTPDKGRVTIDKRDVTATPVWARNIGMVFQSYALFPHMSVRANVAFGLARRGIRGREARLKVDEALEMVRLPGYGERMPSQLSGGQQQRVALARAIVIKPSVLLLDEPLSALDRRLRQEMQVELLRIQRESGLTTIFVTHDQEEALTLSDQIAILDRGAIVQIGRPADVYEKPATRFAAQFLGDSNFLSGTVASGGVRLGCGTLVQVDGPLPPDGAEVTLAVRPEKMLMRASSAAATGDENAIQAVIDEVVYAGQSVTYILRMSDGTQIKLFTQNADGSILEKGNSVRATWLPRHSTILAR